MEPVTTRWKERFPFFRSPLRHVPRNALELRRVWFERNGVRPASFREYCPELLELCLEFGYVAWAFSIRDELRGKDVMDLGCGQSLHGVAFALYGVRGYTGLDPTLDPEADWFKDTRIQRTYNRKPIGWTPRRVSQRIPRLQFRRATIQGLDPSDRWDAITMHNVTEHLMDIEDVFEHLPRHLRPGGRLVFRHPNHYAWNGHHMKPRFVGEIDETDPEQRRYLDWNHVVFDPTWPDVITKRQNRIRLHELRALTERHFEIERWEPRQSTEKEGRERMSDAIAARYPDFTREELLTQSVLCVARPRG